MKKLFATILLTCCFLLIVGCYDQMGAPRNIEFNSSGGEREIVIDDCLGGMQIKEGHTTIDSESADNWNKDSVNLSNGWFTVRYIYRTCKFNIIVAPNHTGKVRKLKLLGEPAKVPGKSLLINIRQLPDPKR